jgi:ATP-binding cassette subfamily C protein LapB
MEKIENNILLECLVALTKIHNHPLSAETLVDGLPLEDGKSSISLFSDDKKNSKSVFSRAAKRAGFSSKLVDYPLKKISKLFFPIILVLKNGDACILLEYNDDSSKAKVISPKNSLEAQWIDYKKLEKKYVNYAFLLKRNSKIEKNIDSIKEHWFWDSIKYSKNIYRDVVVVSFLLNMFMLAAPLYTMNVYDRVVPNLAFDTLWVFSFGILIIYVFDITMKFLRTFFLEIAAKKGDVIISSKVFEYILNIKLEHRFNSVGSFASNIKEYSHIRSFLTSSTIALMIDFPFLLIFIIVIYVIGESIVLVPIFAALIIIFYSMVVRRPLQNKIDKASKSGAYKNSILIESLSSLETIKSMGMNSKFQWKWEESTGDVANHEISSKLISSSITTVANFIVQVSNVSILILGVYLISEQQLSMGGLIALVMLSSRALAPLSQFAILISSYEQAKQGYNTIDKIMKLPIEKGDEKKFVKRPNFIGKIEFKNVKFKYPNSDNYSLNDVSFIINSGENVGFIGTNGSGKTTIIKLIMKLYEPESGSILIDGIDIKQIDPSDLRKSISYIPQDIVLYSGTVRENIVNSQPNATDQEVLKASQMSGVQNFIDTSPLGYDMPVYERGGGLSGGQKQAIGVARGFLKSNASFFLLDEPTNSMDSISEKLVESNIKEFSTDKTTIIVSHKQSILSIMERLILIKDGKVLLDDTNEKVIRKLSNL